MKERTGIMPVDDLFKHRVDESAVAKILQTIVTCPNRRNTPRTGDAPGPFDFWFDGGAARVQTGYVEYMFTDGTSVILAQPVPRLSIKIRFANGALVTVQQHGN